MTLDPVIGCLSCLGRGWIVDRPGLTRACWCRTQPMEAGA